MNDVVFADAASFHGQLQRGRGAAARRAQVEPGAGELVYECLFTDTRWDRQTECRDAYLARLMCRLDLPVAPVEQRLFGFGGAEAEEIDLVVRVMALLASAGRRDAAVALRRYAVEGRHWAAALEALEETRVWKIPEVWDGLAEDLLAAHDDTDLAAHIDGAGELWSSLARTQPRVRRLLNDLAAHQPGVPARRMVPERSIETDSCAELVRRCTHVAGPKRRAALLELGRRGELIVLDLAEDRSLRNAADWTPGIDRALRHLGTGAVPRARRWIGSDDPTLEALAVGVLSDFGDRTDGPYLLHSLTNAAEEGAWCATETPARGLGRLGIREADDALIHLWEATVHSYARAALLEGLRGCAPDKADSYAIEGLDDCEPGVQQAACAMVPDTADVRARLRDLRNDVLAAEIHQAAEQRLTQFAGSEPA